MGGIVSINIFSGRESPRWEVDKRIIASAVEMWQKFNSHNEFGSQLPVLGYRGIELTFDKEEWLVYKKYIRRKSKNRIEYRYDEDRVTEHLLLETCPSGLLSTEILKAIREN